MKARPVRSQVKLLGAHTLGRDVTAKRQVASAGMEVTGTLGCHATDGPCVMSWDCWSSVRVKPVICDRVVEI